MGFTHKDHKIISILYIYIYLLGCNNGGAGGNFSKVNQLVAKWIGIRKRLFSVFLTALVDFRNAITFFRGMIHLRSYVCIFESVHELLKYARTLEFGPILRR